MIRWPIAGSVDDGGHHSDLIRTQTQGVWDQTCVFRGVMKEDSGRETVLGARTSKLASPQSEANRPPQPFCLSLWTLVSVHKAVEIEEAIL